MESKYDKLKFEKRYEVIIERDSSAKEGYEYYAPEEFDKRDKTSFNLTYFFKFVSGEHNPIVVSERIEGPEFSGRRKIVAHFEKNYALKYSVERDGFYELP